MTPYLCRRIGQAVLTALVVSFLTYLLLYLAADPAVVLAGPEATRTDIQLVRAHYGLDKPLLIQYVNWLERCLRGDFGKSFRMQQTVFSLVMERIPLTLTLAATSFVLAALTAISLGTWAATRPGSFVDRCSVFLATVGQATPMFWLGIMFIVLFAVQLGWFPVAGTGTLRHLVLPAITLGIYLIPLSLRLTRSSMLEILSAEYIRTARSKGLGVGVVVGKHALRPAIVPVVSMLAVQAGELLGGTVVVESVFTWPGVGTLAVASILGGDFPVVQGLVLLMSVIFVAINLIADIVIAILDPRIRLG